jgi:hypothetical protein
VVSVVHVMRGQLPTSLIPLLDGRQVDRISAYLVQGNLDGSPARLAANQSKAFIGCFVLGMGFTFDDEAVSRGRPASAVAELDRLIAKDPSNAERIFPYLGGEEVNSDPRHAHRRWVIDFNDFPLGRRALPTTWREMTDRERLACRATGLVPLDYPEPVAEDWPDLLEIVHRLVKPARDNDNREIYRRFWWQFCEKRVGLRRAVIGLPSLIVAPRVSPYPNFTLLPSGSILNEKVVVFASDSLALLAILSSRVSEVWIRAFTSSLKDDLNYAPSDCFDNFPLPHISEKLATAGDEYLRRRAQIMEARNQGLTKVYGQFCQSALNSFQQTAFKSFHFFGRLLAAVCAV